MPKVSSNVLLLMFLYFIQGLPYGLQTQFLPIYFHSKGIDLTSIGFLKFLHVPWLFKFVWGPLVDRFGTKRKWLLSSILCLGITSLVGALASPKHVVAISIIMFLLNLFASVQDVAVDATAIGLLTADELGQGNTAQVVGYKLGSIFGGGILASFVDVIGWLGLFLVITVLYLEAGMFIFVSPTLRNHESIQSYLTTDVHNEDCISVDNCQHSRHACSCPRVSEQAIHHHSHDAAAEGRETKNCCDFITDSKVTATNHSISSSLGRLFMVAGTKWMIVFLLIFKLGEQGALSMLPLFFLDQGLPAGEVTFWSGVIGQGISIFGSLLGGWFVTLCRNVPLDFILQQLCLLRLLPVGANLLLVVVWNSDILSKEFLFYVAVGTMQLLLLISGIITTATFTFMMQCSRTADSDIQATHYTTLATVEVLGKLSFTALCGWLADIFGYRFLFLTFSILSVVVLPWLKHFPGFSDHTDQHSTDVLDEADVNNKTD